MYIIGFYEPMEADSSTPPEIIDLGKFLSMDETIRRQVNEEFYDERTRILPHKATDQSQHY